MKTKLPKLTVQLLRQNKSLVRVGHHRRVVVDTTLLKEITAPVDALITKGKFNNLVPQSINNVMLPRKVSQRGGFTQVTVDASSGFHYEAVAHCSVKDSYDKKRGVAIALGKIATQMHKNGEFVQAKEASQLQPASHGEHANAA